MRQVQAPGQVQEEVRFPLAGDCGARGGLWTLVNAAEVQSAREVLRVALWLHAGGGGGSKGGQGGERQGLDCKDKSKRSSRGRGDQRASLVRPNLIGC